jgi:hypothetical protein
MKTNPPEAVTGPDALCVIDDWLREHPEVINRG